MGRRRAATEPHALIRRGPARYGDDGAAAGDRVAENAGIERDWCHSEGAGRSAGNGELTVNMRDKVRYISRL